MPDALVHRPELPDGERLLVAADPALAEDRRMTSAISRNNGVNTTNNSAETATSRTRHATDLRRAMPAAAGSAAATAEATPAGVVVLASMTEERPKSLGSRGGETDDLVRRPGPSRGP
jgi:hypothetical protein